MKRGYKDTEIGEIPEEWSVVQIDSILESNGNSLRIGPFGSQLKKTLLVDSGYKVYGQENVFANNFSIGNRFISQNHWELLKAFRVKPRDILVTMMGTIGKTTIVPDDIEDGIIDSHLIRISLNTRVVDNAFFVQQFSSPLVKKQLATLSVGGIMDGLSTKIIKKVFYSLPPLPEQKKIAEVLSSVDESIRATQAVIEQAKVLKQGMLNQLLTKGIGHKKFKETEIGEIPEEWEVKKLGNLLDFINGLAYKPSEWDTTGVPIIRIQNLNGGNEYNYFSGDTNGHVCIENGDYLFSWSGSRGTSFGPHLYEGERGVLNQHIFKIDFRTSDERMFIYYALLFITKRIEEEAHGGAGLVHITKTALESFCIPLPDKDEQKKIVIILSSLDNEIERHVVNEVSLSKLKSGLMQDLLSGKKRVKV